MSERVNALTIVLENDVGEEQIEPLISALKQLRGVISVEPHVARMEDHIALVRVRQELSKKLFEVLYPPDSKRG